MDPSHVNSNCHSLPLTKLPVNDDGFLYWRPRKRKQTPVVHAVIWILLGKDGDKNNVFMLENIETCYLQIKASCSRHHRDVLLQKTLHFF